MMVQADTLETSIRAQTKRAAPSQGPYTSALGDVSIADKPHAMRVKGACREDLGADVRNHTRCAEMKHDEVLGVNLFFKICQPRQYVTHTFRRSIRLSELYSRLVIAEENDWKLNVIEKQISDPG